LHPQKPQSAAVRQPHAERCGTREAACRQRGKAPAAGLGKRLFLRGEVIALSITIAVRCDRPLSFDIRRRCAGRAQGEGWLHRQTRRSGALA